MRSFHFSLLVLVTLLALACQKTATDAPSAPADADGRAPSGFDTLIKQTEEQATREAGRREELFQMEMDWERIVRSATSDRPQNERIAGIKRFLTKYPHSPRHAQAERLIQSIAKWPKGLPDDMVRIRAGSFVMGSPPSEAGRYKWETQHRVTLSRDFLLGKYVVTQRDWKTLMGTNPSRMAACGDSCPVENVTWFDAVVYANKRSEIEGLDRCYTLTGCKHSADSGMTCDQVTFKGVGCMGYRLPTESEWEYAARANTTTALYTGPLTLKSDFMGPELDAIAWYGGNSVVSYPGGFSFPDWYRDDPPSEKFGPQPVGRKTPNSWGLYDMIGNISEWVYDSEGDYPSAPVTDPTGPPTRTKHIRRSCNWMSPAKECRAARRGITPLASRGAETGFRLARTLP